MLAEKAMFTCAHFQLFFPGPPSKKKMWAPGGSYGASRASDFFFAPLRTVLFYYQFHYEVLALFKIIYPKLLPIPMATERGAPTPHHHPLGEEGARGATTLMGFSPLKNVSDRVDKMRWGVFGHA
ncbi:unnamed protein product [Phytomonas sp. EM1]|nr:unnamed protein product [Phytomonas sp. EM1]|eukprot:CCW61447.1 unnamed protein product [Phytomonas sp. isolate EM1]